MGPPLATSKLSPEFTEVSTLSRLFDFPSLAQECVKLPEYKAAWKTTEKMLKHFAKKVYSVKLPKYMRVHYIEKTLSRHGFKYNSRSTNFHRGHGSGDVFGVYDLEVRVRDEFVMSFRLIGSFTESPSPVFCCVRNAETLEPNRADRIFDCTELVICPEQNKLEIKDLAEPKRHHRELVAELKAMREASTKGGENGVPTVAFST